MTVKEVSIQMMKLKIRQDWKNMKIKQLNYTLFFHIFNILYLLDIILRKYILKISLFWNIGDADIGMSTFLSYTVKQVNVFLYFMCITVTVLNSMRLCSVGDLQLNTVSEHILCRHRWSAGATEAVQTRCSCCNLCVDTVFQCMDWTVYSMPVGMQKIKKVPAVTK